MVKCAVVCEDAAALRYKPANGEVVETSWAEADPVSIANGRPWRKFPWYLGQTNYSGVYWSATERRHVGYESRLELSRLLLGDFDPDVKRIASQPFQLKTRNDGVLMRRVPDYLMITSTGPLVVDVKRSQEFAKPEIERVLRLTQTVVESRGWRYEVACEPEAIFFANVKFLAAYRRDWQFDPAVLDAIRVAASSESAPSLMAVIHSVDVSKEAAIAGLMHLLWRHELRVDLTRVLCPASTIECRS